MKTRQSGYSLAEMLTVVAIVGVMALVTVPAFVNFYQSNKMKSTMRSFTTDLRKMRQRAITQGKQTMVSYETTPVNSALASYKRQYTFYDGNLPFNSTAWTRSKRPNTNIDEEPHSLDDVVYFPTHAAATPQTAADTVDCSTLPCVTGTDSKRDIIFFPDGRVQVPSGAAFAQVTIKTDMKIPVSQYVIEMSTSGRIKATQ